MRKRLLAGLVGAGIWLWAQDPIADIMMGNRGVRTEISGNLIDIDCFAEHGGFGPEHLECSRFCASRGLPAALLDGQGRIYLIQGRRHQPLTEVNQPLLDYVESTVVIHGELLKRGELRVLVVENIERARKQTPWSEIRALYEGRGGHE
jgi:hypothetical protein